MVGKVWVGGGQERGEYSEIGGQMMDKWWTSAVGKRSRVGGQKVGKWWASAKIVDISGCLEANLQMRRYPKKQSQYVAYLHSL